MPGEDEPLHAYVTASNPESVKKAVDKVSKSFCCLVFTVLMLHKLLTNSIDRWK